MGNPAAAIAFVAKILGLLGSKKAAANSVLSRLKKKARIIKGVPYMPTNYENKNLNELLKDIANEYGGIANIKVATSISSATGGLSIPQQPGQQDQQSLEQEDLDEDIEDVVITTSPSAVQDISVTDCPVDTPVILPEYTREEVEKVIKEIAEECEVRDVTSDLLQGINLNEAIDAICEVTPSEVTPTPQFLPDEEEGEIPEGKEPLDALKAPTKNLVIVSSLSALKDKTTKKVPGITILKKEGDVVSCGEPILKIGSKSVNAVSNGVLKKIYVKNRIQKNSKLFLIEETSPRDKIQEVLNTTESLQKSINDLLVLKERLGKIEPKVWTSKQIYGIYEGQLQGYVAYYSRFDTLVRKREELSREFNTNNEKIKQYNFEKQKGINTASYTGRFDVVLSKEQVEKNKDIIALFTRQDAIIDEISQLTTQIDLIRSEQSSYFVLNKKKESLAAIKRKDVKISYTKDSIGQTYNTAGFGYDFIPFKTGDKLAATELKVISQGLANIIKSFTNNLQLSQRSIDKWKNFNEDINQKNAFTYKDLIYAGSAINFFYRLSGVGGTEVWRGNMWKVRADYDAKVRNLPNTISQDSNTDIIEKQVNDLREEERRLPDTIERFANDTFDRVVEYSKNYGYYQINRSSIFIQSGTNYEKELEDRRNKSRSTYETFYQEYLEIRKRIVEIEKEIEEFPDKVERINSGECGVNEFNEPTSSTVDGDNVTIFSWPKTDGEGPGSKAPPKDDPNYKGNPKPNSPPVTTMKYWRKYCRRATTVNLLPLFWPIGLLIPTSGPLIKIPLPIIWRPLAVIPTPLCVIVIGLAICGICPAPFVYIVNPGWPFPISLAKPKSSWFLTGIRGPSKIDDETTSKPLGAIPTVNVPLSDKVPKPVKFDAAPFITKALPLIQDDLPPYERLTLSNLPYVAYLGKWCKAGKKTMGFFENP